MGRSIGILGGSFDPVHNGHIAIAESFLGSEFIDELWLVLAPDPPHKNEQSLTEYAHRLTMLEMAFSTFDRVSVSDIETTLPQPSYTVQTLKYLHKTHPNNTYYLCMGGDSLRDFTQWKDWQLIIDYCDLLVARRPSADTTLPNNKLTGKVHFVDHEPISISSSQIRENIIQGRTISDLVPESVHKYIKANNLYSKI
ncbi:MAG: nicotinate (nicotinamide) nucleotide adenylyltransferase [Bacteroidota bacterium]